MKTPTVMQPARFCLEAFDDEFEGFTTGETWNGWECPLFTLAEARRIAAAHNSAACAEEGDGVIVEHDGVFLNETTGDRWEATAGLYAIGAGSWCWDMVADAALTFDAEYEARIDARIAATPASIAEAREWLAPAIGEQPGSLSDESLRRAWYAVAYLFPGVHPDESGGPVEATQTVPSWDDRLSVCCADGGWPVALLPLSAEVWRRFSDEADLYPCDAQQAGIAAGE